MGKQNSILKLDPTDQEIWLIQHLPNRVGAAWVCLPGIAGEWGWGNQHPLQPSDFAESADANQVWCICRAVEHGQKAAMRSLIEFVGVALSKAGRLCRPSGYDDGTGTPKDVSIQSFANDGSDLRIPLTDTNGSTAWTLANVWKGCTQSCVHFTFKTGHPHVDPPDIAKAFVIIVEHLQVKLYGTRGKRLSEIVRDQH